jgi:spoIIIJ-associated protein
MQWVETTGRTVDEAKAMALDQLGVDVDDAEFEVVEEPRPGLFGRVRGEARVRARVRPTAPRAKTERRSTRKKSGRSEDAGTTVVDEAAAAASDAAPQSRPTSPKERQGGRPQADRNGRRDENRPPKERTPRPAGDPVAVEQVGAEAVKFLEGLLDAYQLDGTVAVVQDGSDLEVSVDGDDLGLLIGPRGNTLLALQDVTRVVSQRRLGDHDSHLRVDVAGYRQRRKEALARFTEHVIEDVRSTGQASVLEPMPSADRKVVHDTVAAAEGVTSRSEGDDPFRRVVILPQTVDG